MHTKNSDRRSPVTALSSAAGGPAFPDTVAYWLEDEEGNRVSRLFAISDRPLRLAGRVLENVGNVGGWSLARRDVQGDRHIVATGTDLARLATPHMPVRTPAEAEAIDRFHRALRRDPAFPSRAETITDERVY